MKFRILIAFLGIPLLVGGCAVGNQYQYENADIALPVRGSATVGLAVIDNRSYVLDGSKSADFVGLQRGGFGNPFDVTTASGNPLAQDISISLEKALQRNGYTVKQLDFSSPDQAVIVSAVSRTANEKNIVLKITEWKTDVMMRIKVNFKFELNIFDENGTLLASNSMQGEDAAGGAGFESQNSTTAISTLALKLGRLFNHPDVVASLSD